MKRIAHTTAVLGVLTALVAPRGAAAAPTADAVSLLTDSAAAVAGSESVSAAFDAVATIVRDERTDEVRTSARFRTAPGGRFEFRPVDESGEPIRKGWLAVGNGRVTVIASLGRRSRHMLVEDSDGVADFIRTPGASSIGTGLGALALSLFSPAETERLVANLSAGEVLGEVTVDGERLVYARYTVQCGLVWDAWFAADGPRLIRRIVPDLSGDPGVNALGERHDRFSYQQEFLFDDWDLEAGLADNAVEVVEPKNSLLVSSLFEPPPTPPYHLLGRQAPQYDLPTVSGDRVTAPSGTEAAATLIEFWSTSCPVCLKAMPQLEKLQERFADQGLAYHAINAGDEPGVLGPFLEQRGLSSEALVDADGAVADQYRVSTFPLILLVDAEGVVQVARVGFDASAASELASQIEAVLEGADLAAEATREWRERQARAVAELKRLKKLLDG